ncbi:CAP domain-containing protein [Microbispora rosea]|uniref:CAP domain-containing protein n=1 Tax=Microbispora rosea TaxID=58117 RepID=UPI00068A6CC9|nr:CAP domain-containing protein [Microbispora rosea]
MGLLACAVAILLTGVVIGRMSARSSVVDGVYLREAEPSPSSSVMAAGAEPRDRPTLDHVLGTVAPVTPRQVPQRRPRKEKPPSTLIDGSDSGSRHTVITPGGDGGGDEYDADSMRAASMEAEVVRLVNAERRKHGCRPLRVDPRLVESARAHSDEMASSKLFRHSSPGGASPWDRMGAAGYSEGGAETIARGYQTAQTVVRGWMAGRSDRATLLNCGLVATGVGVSMGEGGPWWTEDFGYS